MGFPSSEELVMGDLEGIFSAFKIKRRIK